MALGVGLGNGGVPHGVQVCACVVVGYRDVITTHVEVFVVEGLVDVADKVDDEF